MSDLTTEQDAAVECVVLRCRKWGGLCSEVVHGSNMVAHATVFEGNRNAIRWWIGVGDAVEIEGVAEIDFHGNRVK